MYLLFRNTIAYIISLYLFITLRIRNRLKYIDENHVILSLYGHNPNKLIFEKTIKWLIKKKFIFITLQDLIAFLKNEKTYYRPVWISFDDGWKNNIENVLPILDKYNIEATFFVSTQLIIDGYYWLAEFRKIRNKLPFDIEKLKYISETERRELIKKYNPLQFSNIINRDFITLEELKSHMFDCHIIGSHTHNHVICTNCNQKELEDELRESKSILMSLSSFHSGIFAFPNGNYNDWVINVLKTKSSIKYAFTTEPKLIIKNENPYCILRTGMLDSGSLIENICHIMGVWQPFILKFKSKFK